MLKKDILYSMLSLGTQEAGFRYPFAYTREIPSNALIEENNLSI
ncbi:hypothetical protein KDI_40380 [Dictyobacter arantiisoli]|uniref:Uncharacterized protein n=1 Tax=Dictyobacter arantiisoli TaxID=2014874 RepID=A0A5A5THN3_9CHLR|nr:hypothetical protein KDI_40380 [Dictyobacter arantiisoli]